MISLQRKSKKDFMKVLRQIIKTKTRKIRRKTKKIKKTKQ
jgi:hypothetical protein